MGKGLEAAMPKPQGKGEPGTYNWTGNMSEIVVYNRRLSSTERTQVLNYLNAKYTIY